MPLRSDPGNELGAFHDLLAHDEKHSSRARVREELQHRGCPLGMRPIVERENDPGIRSECPLDPERAGGARKDRSERMADHEWMIPDLDDWIPRPTLRVEHRRESSAPPERLWAAAKQVRLTDAALLGRLVRWRIPGMPADISFDQMFRREPFTVLDGDHDRVLVSGLVGRIWTLRRDYPRIGEPEEFREWSTRGTARVLFANWVQPNDDGSILVSESRVEAIGIQGRVGIGAVRPLVRAFHPLIASDGIEAAVRRAEG